MEAYISFAKEDGREISNSVYVGSLNATPLVSTEIKSEEEVKTAEVQKKDKQQENQSNEPVICQQSPVPADLEAVKRTNADVPPS